MPPPSRDAERPHPGDPHTLPAPDRRPPLASTLAESVRAPNPAGQRNMQLLVQLRWIAVVGQLLTILLVHFGLDVRLPLTPMLAVLVALFAFNLFAMLHWRRRERVTHLALLISLLVDVAALTLQLSLSGGIANPFVFLYLLQVVLAAILLRTWSTALIVLVTTSCVIGLALFPGPVLLPSNPDEGLGNTYVLGLLLCFALIAVLLAVFITRIGRNIRDRDARLAELRQRAVEEEHIVRMGLLASGAAHELGTPLSTLSVILGDWRHSPHFSSDEDLLRDVSEMQSEVLRCKAIVTNILMSAGSNRGDAPAETTLRAFLDGLALDWQESRPVQSFDYRYLFPGDPAIISDTGLRQMVFNVLDNALEASPRWLEMTVFREGPSLVIEINDAGNGFPAFVLDNIGKPYQSSKGRPGGGLGLFLSMNVARMFGGKLEVRNREHGGANVTMRLPLQALMLEDDDDGQ